RRRVRKLVGETVIELDCEPLMRGFLAGTGKRLRVGIEADDLDLRKPLPNKDSQRAGPAAQVENAVGGTKPGLSQQLLSRSLGAEDFQKWIVERQKYVAPCRGKISAWRWRHVADSWCGRFVSGHGFSRAGLRK